MDYCKSNYFMDTLPKWFSLIIFIIIFIFLTVLIIIFGNKQYIIDNWVEYRCDPFIMPFASFFGKNSADNLNQCLSVQFHSHKGSFLSPILSITGIITQTLKGILHSFNDLRKFMNIFRVFHLNFASGIVSRISDVGSTMQILLVKVKSILERLVGILVTLIYTGFTAMKSIENIFLGPIGSMAKFFCFGEKTYINLINNKKKLISEIKIGDKIKEGGIVLGVLKFNSKNVEMYNFRGIEVSGSHFIFYNSLWQRIDQIKESKVINYNQPYIYCLITQYNKISIKQSIFRDYIETSNININNLIKEEILNLLNKTKNKLKPLAITNDYYLNGFGKNTKLKLLNGSNKKISELKIGEILSNNNKIIGITKFFPINGICIYENIVVSPNQIVNSNGKWIRIIDSKKCYKTYKYNGYIYNLITENNNIIINNNHFRDYEEIPDTDINIDTIIYNHLNKKNIDKLNLRC